MWGFDETKLDPSNLVSLYTFKGKVTLNIGHCLSSALEMSYHYNHAKNTTLEHFLEFFTFVHEFTNSWQAIQTPWVELEAHFTRFWAEEDEDQDSGGSRRSRRHPGARAGQHRPWWRRASAHWRDDIGPRLAHSDEQPLLGAHDDRFRDYI